MKGKEKRALVLIVVACFNCEPFSYWFMFVKEREKWKGSKFLEWAFSKANYDAMRRLNFVCEKLKQRISLC